MTAVRNLSIATVVSGATLSLVWLRNMRRIVESPEIAGNAGSGPVAWCTNALLRMVVRRPLDRAIILFTGPQRTVKTGQ